jgi:dihydroorotate dehydrogenase
VSPDLTDPALEEVLAVCTEAGAEGLIAVNTTLARDSLQQTDRATAAEPGGLSGAPLARRARHVVSFLAARSPLPIIGVGGILTRDDGQAMLDAGASLVQVYTGYIYQGPGLISQLNLLNSSAAGAPW